MPPRWGFAPIFHAMNGNRISTVWTVGGPPKPGFGLNGALRECRAGPAKLVADGPPFILLSSPRQRVCGRVASASTACTTNDNGVAHPSRVLRRVVPRTLTDPPTRLRLTIQRSSYRRESSENRCHATPSFTKCVDWAGWPVNFATLDSQNLRAKKFFSMTRICH